MPHNIKNFGIAAPKVKLLAAAPYIDRNPIRMNFHIGAEAYPQLINSTLFPPLLTEATIDAENEAFSVIYPSKRKTYIDNFIKIDGVVNTSLNKWVEENKDKPYITWNPVSYKSLSPKNNLVKELLNNFNQVEYNSKLEGTSGYKGPVWKDTLTSLSAPPDDEAALSEFRKWLSTTEEKKEEPKTEEKEDKTKTVRGIEQSVVLEGLWWGVQSNSFITSEMPFWINIKKRKAPPTAKKYPTVFVISFGLDSKNQRFDLILPTDAKPYIVDYVTSASNETPSSGSTLGKPKSSPPYKTKEWDVDLARLIKEKDDIEIGIMTAGGRLIICINQIQMIYTRIDDGEDDSGGKISPVRIAPGSVSVFGTNVIATINACPMIFANTCAVALPIPSTNGLSKENKPVEWTGVDEQGESAGSVAELPKPSSVKNPLFGVDCYEFDGPGGKCSPDGPGFHRQGKVWLKSSSDKDFKDYERLKNADEYILQMSPFDGQMLSASGKLIRIANMGAPYFFRVRGVAKIDPEESQAEGLDVSNYVLNISETSTAPDFFHIKRSATITFYNENNIMYNQLKSQKAIQISWGWVADGEGIADFTPSFTGLVNSINLTQTAGSETVTVNCEDYMYVLNSVPLINSPFYDGMVAVYAIMDLAKRGGCMSPQNKFRNEKDYFLPSGFAYTKPRVKFPSMNKIFDCIIDLVKRFEAFVYFDGDGRFVIEKLPGGLFSNPTEISASFSQDPKNAEQDHIVLGELNPTVDYSSTVNQVSIMSLERDTRNYIVYSTVATEDLLLFKRAMFLEQPALGEIEAVRQHAKDIGKRVFKAIKKVNIKTVGGNVIKPLDFVKIAGQPFRVTSFKRNFAAEANDFTQDLECEWLGG